MYSLNPDGTTITLPATCSLELAHAQQFVPRLGSSFVCSTSCSHRSRSQPMCLEVGDEDEIDKAAERGTSVTEEVNRFLNKISY